MMINFNSQSSQSHIIMGADQSYISSGPGNWVKVFVVLCLHQGVKVYSLLTQWRLAKHPRWPLS